MKPKKIIISVVSAVILIAAIVAGVIINDKYPRDISYDIDSIKSVGTDKNIEIVSKTDDTVTIKKLNAGDVKIIAFTDTHFDGKNKTTDITLEHMLKAIEKEKPDLVLFDGDNVTSGNNKTRSHQMAQIFENLGVYWAGVIGNHEGDNSMSISRTQMMDIFTSYEHCLMLKGRDDVIGDCNYVLNILNSKNKLEKGLIFFDTFDEITEDIAAKYGGRVGEYDGTKPEQVEWYKEKIAENQKIYKGYKSIMFMHIPLPQLEEQSEKTEYDYGTKNENVCESDFDSGMFDAIKELGSTNAVYFGHDHVNDFGLTLDGIQIGYIQNSGWGSYSGASKGWDEKDWLQGYSVITLTGNGNHTFESHKYTEWTTTEVEQ